MGEKVVATLNERMRGDGLWTGRASIRSPIVVSSLSISSSSLFQGVFPVTDLWVLRDSHSQHNTEDTDENSNYLDAGRWIARFRN